MAQSQTIKLAGADASAFMEWRKTATSEARKVLAAELADALNLQNKTVDDAIKIKVVSEDGKTSTYRDALDAGKFWDSLVAVIEKAKAENLQGGASVALAALDETLGNPEALDMRANTVRTYRAGIRVIAPVYMSDNWSEACALAGTGQDGKPKALDAEGKPLPLHRLSYATARKAATVINKSDEERQFARELAELVSELKEAGKNRAANKKEGIVALDAVPLKTLIETVQAFRGMVPERTMKGVESEQEAAPTGTDHVAPDAQPNIRAA